jgi:hypothetical protein
MRMQAVSNDVYSNHEMGPLPNARVFEWSWIGLKKNPYQRL